MKQTMKQSVKSSIKQNILGIKSVHRSSLCRKAAIVAVLMMLLSLLYLTGCSGTSGSGSGGNGTGSTAPEPVTGENYYLDTICTISVYEIKLADSAADSGETSDLDNTENAADSDSTADTDGSSGSDSSADTEVADNADDSDVAENAADSDSTAGTDGSSGSDSSADTEVADNADDSDVAENAADSDSTAGTPVPASGSAEAEEAANAAIDKAFERCAEFDKMLSRTNDASEVSAVNNAGGDWVEVSNETLELIQMGMQYSHESDGDFDITIGSVTSLWDFHADPEDAKVPDADDLAEAVKHVNFRDIAIEGNKVRLTDPEAKIDLGGIAKGYIGDRMTEVLEAEGVTSAIINLGGNVICIGAKDNSAAAGEGDFVIGVETPYSDRTEIVGKVNAADMTLVTSGVYERQIEVDGKVYHHILSTKTGYSVETELISVTLTGSKGQSGELDALSTICLIKGCDEAKALIEKKDGVEAVLIKSDGSIEQTSGMEFTPVN